MVRDENGKQNIEAGLDLAKALREMGYTQGVLCYLGPKFRDANQIKFEKAGLGNVYCTFRKNEAEAFAKFQDLPGHLEKCSTITPPSKPNPLGVGMGIQTSSTSSTESSSSSSSSSDSTSTSTEKLDE